MPVLYPALSVRAAVLKQQAKAHFRRKIMLQNAVIDVAIGLILMYLMLSLLCTAVNEYIATKLSIRATTLRDTLQKLIDDPKLRTYFYEHGLIASNSRASGTGLQSMLQVAANLFGASSLLKNQVTGSEAPAAAAGAAAGGGGAVAGAGAAANGGGAAAGAGAAAAPVASDEAEHPSYLASGTVALAIMGSLLKRTPGTADMNGLQAAIAALPADSKIKDSLQATLLKAGDDIHKLEKGIATWFDDSMDRLSGAYKRKMKWIAMLIGLLVAIAFNADSFKVATTLWNDPDRRASTIAIATEIASKKPVASTQPDQEKLEAAVKDTEKMLRSLPIGWNCLAAPDGSIGQCWKNLSLPTLVQFLGWILTALALSLGAPFWFDLLNKFINLRGAGVKPKREDGK
jgi:hypothetical protein